MEPHHNLNEKLQDSLKVVSENDTENSVPELADNKILELVDNNNEKFESKLDRTPIKDNMKTTETKIARVEDEESPFNNNKRSQGNVYIGSIEDIHFSNAKPKLINIEVIEPPYDDDETSQSNMDTSLINDNNKDAEAETNTNEAIDPNENENQKENVETSSVKDIILDTPPKVLESPSKDDSMKAISNIETKSDERATEEESPSNDSEKPQGRSDNISNMKLEHMMSLRVVLKRAKYIGCESCNLVFFRPRDAKVHAVKHLLPASEYNDEDRFVKRFKCDQCGLRFVQLSTLEAHMAVHAPFPHPCRCGVAFRRARDLASHRNLVHLAEIRQHLATLTDRKQRALKTEIWEPYVDYAGVKREPPVKPRVRIRLKPKTPRLPPAVPRFKTEEEENIIQNDDKTFSCPLCFKVFKAKANVKIHLVTHSGVKPYECEICEARFTQVAALSLHLKRHTGVKEFRCNFCEKEFYSYNNMQNHIRTHTKEKPFKCSFCPKAFSDPSAHKRHHRTHTGEKPYSCRYCEMRFSDASGLIAHRRRHDSEKQIKCLECSKAFWTKHDLRKHTTTVHGSEKNFHCEKCDKSFALKSYLYIHMKSHDEMKRFECDHCGFRTRVKVNLKKHIETAHLHIKKEKCPECGMRFYDKNYLNRHVAVVHTRPLNYQCDMCGHRQSCKSLIFKHIIEKHSLIKCTRCLKPFSNNASLQKHAERGCLKCDCGKYFPTKNMLNTHKLVHERKKPFLCDYCDKRFKTEGRLKKHYFTIHEKTKKKYECDECGQMFYSKTKLVSHIYSLHFTLLYCHRCPGQFYSDYDLKRHKAQGICGVKHKCEVCDKVFTTYNKLNSHLAVHIPFKFYCDHCSSKFKRRTSMARHIERCHKHIIKTKTKKGK